MRGALVVTAVLTAVISTQPLAQPPEDELGVTGYVLTPEGLPVAGGTVSLRLYGSAVVANISHTGRFRIVPHMPGPHEMYVSAPRLMTRRVNVAVPASKTLMLPPIRLSNASSVQIRFVSPSGEPLSIPWVARQSFDVSGARIWEPPSARSSDENAPEGATVVGPLPRGVTTLLVDAPPLARTRLPDVRVTGESSLIDGGVVRLEPGAVLSVDVVDEAGNPVIGHEVYLDEARPFSPGMLPPQRTNAEGRATFDRLASGRYRLRTRTLLPCGDRFLTVARAVDAPGAGTVHRRLVIGGRATLRVTSGGAALIARVVSLTPDSPPSAPAAWLRGGQSSARGFEPFGPSAGTPCVGVTDRSGLVTLSSMPPGPARVAVHLPYARWVRRIEVPERPREISVDVPTGIMSLRVLRADTRAPISGASVVWTSGGTRVEASTSAMGDALLDGVGLAGGTVAIDARGYVTFRQRFAAPPDILHEITLQPARDESLQAHIVNEARQPLAGAVVELIPEDPMEDSYVATADAGGLVRFFAPPPGALRMVARADDYVAATVPVPSQVSGPITITLSRGYRILARVGQTAASGPYRVHVLTRTGTEIDDLLDAASDRIIDRAGVVSLGPVSPGAYIVELRGPAGTRRIRVEIASRDAHVTFQ